MFNEFCCYILVFFWLITYYRQGHNLDLLKFTKKQVNSSRLAMDPSQYEIKAKCVSQPKMAPKACNDLASATNTHRISQNLPVQKNDANNMSSVEHTRKVIQNQMYLFLVWISNLSKGYKSCHMLGSFSKNLMVPGYSPDKNN